MMFILSLIIMYLFPLMFCHLFTWIGNKFVLYEDYLFEPSCMFVLGLIPFINCIVVGMQICGYIIHLFVTIYRKSGLSKTKFSFDKLYEKYYDFIMGNK